MKKITVLIAFIFPAILHAQSVAINTDASAPHNSAILDIKSDSKGLLMPRLTTLQRTSIASPALGLTVFDTETYSFWMYRGDLNGGWAEMQHSFQNYWGSTGSNVINTNSGNIGIGTNVPGEKLSLNAPNAAIQFMNSGTPRGFLQTNNADMRLGTYGNNATGKLVFNTKAVDRMWIDENGKVGIGTSTPTYALTINGSNTGLLVRHDGADVGTVRATSVHLLVGTNTNNPTGTLTFETQGIPRATIDKNGLFGIGTVTPSSALTINAVNPIFAAKKCRGR